MRALIMFVGVIFSATSILAADFAPRQFTIEEVGTSFQVQGERSSSLYPNTVGKDEFGDMIWIVRQGTTFLASYMIKDANENPLWIERLTLSSQKKDGTWVIYADGSWNACSVKISSNLYAFHVTVDLTLPQFQEFQVGERINFRYYFRFKDGLLGIICINLVEKNQYFQVIKGEPLPLYTGQYSANTHGHSYYTDDVFEWGGSQGQIKPACVASDLDIYWWTDHGYDFNAVERDSMTAFARRISDANFLVIPGCEAQTDNNNTNDFPDGFLHCLTSNCFLTPWEYQINNTLWTLPQLIDSVSARQGYWLAAHPFDPPYYSSDERIKQWIAININQALATPRFLGFEIWNGMRTSTKSSVPDVINPFPWVADYSDQAKLMNDVAVLDSLQAAHVSPLRRVLAFAGADNHGDYNYTIGLTLSGSKIWNNALGKCFTVAEMPSLTLANFWSALSDGRCYMSNGPGCQFGVDQNADNQIDVGLGGHFFITDLGKVKLFGKSNDEFGNFTQGIIYWVTASGKDSLVVPLYSQNALLEMPVSFLPPETGFIRGILKTAGGYGDYPGLVITNPVYFDFSSVTEADHLAPPKPRIAAYPSPSQDLMTISWSAAESPTRLTIYNAAGQSVFTEKISGETSVVWRNRGLASGVYFILLDFSNLGPVTKKVTVIR